MRFALALLFAGAVNAAAAPPAHPPAASANALLHRIAQQGGRRVLSDLWKDDRAFDAAMDGIESASRSSPRPASPRLTKTRPWPRWPPSGIRP